MTRGRIISGVAISLLMVPAAWACVAFFGGAMGLTILAVGGYVGVNGTLWVIDEMKG